MGTPGLWFSDRRRQMGVLFAMVSSEETTTQVVLLCSLPGRQIRSLQSRSGVWQRHQRLGSHLPDSSRRSVPATQETIF